uniref:Syntaxin binding protein 6 n=1 Tax=Eptatretus burgeri TaxID=7764 RepID=A0A8C4R9C0_EPTBU
MRVSISAADSACLTRSRADLSAARNIVTMGTKQNIGREVFGSNERMLTAALVQRRTPKKIPFLPAGGSGRYTTYLCVSGEFFFLLLHICSCSCTCSNLFYLFIYFCSLFSLFLFFLLSPAVCFSAVTNDKPHKAFITKVKKFDSSEGFVQRSRWTLAQIQRVDGISVAGNSTEFDIIFDECHDQWSASSSAEKGTFLQILHHTCQRYISPTPSFVNCPPHCLTGAALPATAGVGKAISDARRALDERGAMLGTVECNTQEMQLSAQNFARTAHKLAQTHRN